MQLGKKKKGNMEGVGTVEDVAEWWWDLMPILANFIELFEMVGMFLKGSLAAKSSPSPESCGEFPELKSWPLPAWRCG